MSNQQEEVATKKVTILNEQGLHARPVMQLVDLASQFQSNITVTKGSQKVDGKSPMEVMLLEAVQGTELIIAAVGPDAKEAVAALADLVQRKFE